jgi:hypothetical protein
MKKMNTGLAFDEKELIKIFNKFKFSCGQRLSEGELHGALVHNCTAPNPVSKYVEKLLKRRFEPYQNRVGELEQKDLPGLIERRDGFKDIPLPAFIWFAARGHHEEVGEVESQVFNTVHIKEHQALRLYDALARTLLDGRPEDVLSELKKAVAATEDLQKRYGRSEQKKARLRAEIEAIKREKLDLALERAEQRKLNERLQKELEKLGGEVALEQIEKLKQERELLATEVRSLNEELLRQELSRVADIFSEPLVYHEGHTEDRPVATSKIWEELLDEEPDTYLPLILGGMKVALVGGLESLVPYYRQMIESLGGVFCDYRGECQGRKEAENIVNRADVVFCPVNINSHSACRCIKKVCKLTGKPCCFMRSSSLSMLRRELVEFAKSLN